MPVPTTGARASELLRGAPWVFGVAGLWGPLHVGGRSLGLWLAERFAETPQSANLIAELTSLVVALAVDPLFYTLILAALLRVFEPGRGFGAVVWRLLLPTYAAMTVMDLGMVIIVPGLAIWGVLGLAVDPLAFVRREPWGPRASPRRWWGMGSAMGLVMVLYLPSALWLVYEVQGHWAAELAYHLAWRVLAIAVLVLWVATSPSLDGPPESVPREG